MEQPCTVYTPKSYSCIVCHKKIHRGDEGCCCSTLKQETFNLGSLCMPCANAFDSLIADAKKTPILKFLLDREYWRGAGPVVDF